MYIREARALDVRNLSPHRCLCGASAKSALHCAFVASAMFLLLAVLLLVSVAQAFRAAPKMGRLRTHAPAIAMQVKKSGNTDARVPTAEESRKKNPTGVPIADKFKVRVRVRVRARVS